MKYFFVGSLLFFVAFVGDVSAKTFTVTAYYSPLPGQANYEKEVALNGSGNHGASGKEVFSGMIAASKNYPFGTKIYLEGIGVGEISDRGGAMSDDKIDIWMGYGEEGRKRAIAWGRRTVEGYEVDQTMEVSIDVESFSDGSFVDGELQAPNQNTTNTSDSLDALGLPNGFFETSLSLGDSSKNVEHL